MPFYRSSGRGDTGHFPINPPKPAVVKKKRKEYIYIDRKELIAMCDERGILSAKGTPISRSQKKAYYVDQLTQWDEQQARLAEFD